MDELKKLKEQNAVLENELLKCKNAIKPTEDKWMLALRIVGILLIVAGLYESVYTMFDMSKEVVEMGRFRIGSAIVGFLLFAGNKQLGKIANQIGSIALKYLGKVTGTN